MQTDPPPTPSNIVENLQSDQIAESFAEIIVEELFDTTIPEHPIPTGTENDPTPLAVTEEHHGHEHTVQYFKKLSRIFILLLTSTLIGVITNLLK